MKQKDIALLIVVAFISTIVSLVASNFIFTPDDVKQQKAEVVEPISAEFNTPTAGDKYFNNSANNPTQLIKIGEDPNANPFKDASN
ncbi:hypothetical protein KC946_02760 [Candidatus Saccharibacteria bacterium]|nr:hypothetical protein [Candidatus Saccharibacteria bacterium]